MRVSFDLSALRANDWHQYALRFVLGGLATVVAGLIAKEFGPQWGGLFLAFPAIFPAAATLIARREREKKARKGIDGRHRGKQVAALDAAGAVLGSVGLGCFAACVWYGAPLYPAAVVLLGASAVWLLVSVLLWWLRKKHAWRSAVQLELPR